MWSTELSQFCSAGQTSFRRSAKWVSIDKALMKILLFGITGLLRQAIGLSCAQGLRCATASERPLLCRYPLGELPCSTSCLFHTGHEFLLAEQPPCPDTLHWLSFTITHNDGQALKQLTFLAPLIIIRAHLSLKALKPVVLSILP